MIRVDTREGSKDYIAPLKAVGLEVEPCILAAGDFEIMGNGPSGRVIPIGVEVKQWDDVMACVRNGRFADQLRGMHAAYEVNWLLIEGRIKAVGKEVAIRKGDRWYAPPGRMSYQELTGWLLTMCSAAGVLLWRTESQQESVEWLRSLYWWWVSKDYEQHRAHLDFYLPPVTDGPIAPWQEPSLVVKLASVLPGIGSKLAYRVAEEFESIAEMIDAPAERWQTVEGIGPKRAEQLVRAIRFQHTKSGS